MAYIRIEKYYQKNKIRKYLDKKYKLCGIPDLKSYWSSTTGQEEEILFDDETTIYADVVGVTVDNVQKSLNCVYKHLVIFHYSQHIVLFFWYIMMQIVII